MTSSLLQARPGTLRVASPSGHHALSMARFRAAPMLSSARPMRVAAAAEAEADDEGLTGEWPVNWSLASYEDVGEFFQNSLFKDSASPGNSLKDIMSTDLTFTTPEAKIDDLGQLFAKVQSWSDLPVVICQQGAAFPTAGRLPRVLQVTGVPVVKSETDMTLIGVLSKKDLDKKGKLVKDIFSSPPVAARPENKVADAAALMLKHKVRGNAAQCSPTMLDRSLHVLQDWYVCLPVELAMPWQHGPQHVECYCGSCQSRCWNGLTGRAVDR